MAGVTDEATTPPLTGGALTRSRILDAAAHLMGTAGLARTTTKAIAAEAGCSEATLYKHFRDKEEIFVGVLHERGPRFSEALAELPDRAGEGEVADHLREVAAIAVRFYRQSFPMAGSLFASPELLAAHRRKLDPDTSGPHTPTKQLTAYLAAEQKLGRVAADVAPEAAAALLIGACFHRAFLSLFFATDAPPGALHPPDDDAFAAQTVQSLLTGTAPRTPGNARREGVRGQSAEGGSVAD